MSFYIKEFLNNPAGKGSSILNINATKQQYTQRYDKIVKQINQRIFIVKKDNKIIIGVTKNERYFIKKLLEYFFVILFKKVLNFMKKCPKPTLIIKISRNTFFS